MGLVGLCYKVLRELEKREIKYPDPLYNDMKTLKTSLESIESLFKFKDK